MMKKLAVGLAAAVLATTPAHAVRLFAVDETNNLISFDSSNPGTNLSSVAISVISGASVLAIDYRVLTGVTYVLTDDRKLYSLSLPTGAATLFADVSAMTGVNFAFDFNPANANLRIVSNDNSNYVFNFVTNTLVPGANVAYGAADPSFGLNPDITAAAYLNNDNDPATGTTLFTIDTANDVLTTQNPATGVLTTVGPLGVNLGARTSFDIATNGTTNTPFVLNGNNLFSINLATGALSSIGNTSTSLFALTAVPNAAVPEPATWGLMLIGFGMIGAALRRPNRVRVRVGSW